MCTDDSVNGENYLLSTPPIHLFTVDYRETAASISRLRSLWSLQTDCTVSTETGAAANVGISLGASVFLAPAALSFGLEYAISPLTLCP